MQSLRNFRNAAFAGALAAVSLLTSPTRTANVLSSVEHAVAQSMPEQIKQIFPYLHREHAPDGNYLALPHLQQEQVEEVITDFPDPSADIYLESEPQDRTRLLIRCTEDPARNALLKDFLQELNYTPQAVLRRGNEERTVPLEVLLAGKQDADLIWALYAPPDMTLPYAREIHEAVRAYVPESEWVPAQNWLQAKLHVESNGNPRARSPKDARGLMQVLPATAQDEDRLWGKRPRPISYYAKRLSDPAFCIDAGTRYFERNRRYLQQRFGTHWVNLLQENASAYNAGLGATLSGAAESFKETQDYIDKMFLKVMEISYAQDRRMQEAIAGAQDTLSKPFSRESTYTRR